MAATRARQVDIAKRRTAAVQLRISGHQWQYIADQLGYSSRGSACADVQIALQEAIKEQNWATQEYRQQLLERIQAQRGALWPDLESDDPKIRAGAVDRLVKLDDQEADLRGLRAPVKTEVTTYDYRINGIPTEDVR